MYGLILVCIIIGLFKGLTEPDRWTGLPLSERYRQKFMKNCPKRVLDG